MFAFSTEPLTRYIPVLILQLQFYFFIVWVWPSAAEAGDLRRGRRSKEALLNFRHSVDAVLYVPQVIDLGGSPSSMFFYSDMFQFQL
jgi:hypothetical protein